ncbi:GNAT family N-acetyltransferase [Actinospica robiniae]|uniref:GNAT family N-acetyltransferase n=1 Tax=Actinospica robiniae TaxID=304901 RepID=UPI000427981E|nr:GNAT family N-acetyltransferase [Actinospica robiniae]
MTDHGWTLTGDASAFADASLEFLSLDPVGNTIILGIAAGLRTSPRQPREQDCYGWWVDEEGRLGAAFAAQYPYPVTLGAQVSERAAAELPAVWQASGRDRPIGVAGGVRVAEDIAARWARLLGLSYRAKANHEMRLFSFAEPTPPDTAPAGHGRLAGPADVAMLCEWDLAFFRDCGLTVPHDPEPFVRARVLDRRQLLWTRGGEPVACANFTGVAAGGSRITGVYTPPEHRRHGYAAGVTWAAAHEALARGAEHVMLHTDLANPTSNAIYQRIGFRPVRDVTEFEFV